MKAVCLISGGIDSPVATQIAILNGYALSESEANPCSNPPSILKIDDWVNHLSTLKNEKEEEKYDITKIKSCDINKEFALVTYLKNIYQPLLIWAIDNRKRVLLFVFIAFVLSLIFVPFLGTEFIPTLEEGSILIGVTMAPSTSLEKGTEIVQSLERKIIKLHEVEEVVSRIGRPEAGSHPHPVNYAEIHIELKEQKDWKNYKG